MGANKIISFDAVLREIHPQLYRVAIALCGGRKSGKTVITTVLAQSEDICDRWHSFEEAQRWFLRYTVLCSRETTPVGTADDPLFAVADAPAWQAIVVAIRHLPAQQREAFLLHYGERLDPRAVAIATDCSSSAAANHLRAATVSMKAIAGGSLEVFIAALPGMLNRLLPEEGLVTEINRVVRNRRRKRWVRRWILLPAKWGLVAVGVWAIWRLVHWK